MHKENSFDSNTEVKQRVRIKIRRIIATVIGGIFMAAGFALLFGIVVKLLWNGLMPTIFGLPAIHYWQALGILILAKILFGSFGHGHSSRHAQKKTDSKWHCFMGVDESGLNYQHHHDWAKDMKPQWKDYHRFWEQEGRQAFEDFCKKQETETAKPPAE